VPSAAEARDPKRSRLERFLIWAVIGLSLPGLAALGLLPLASMPFESITESMRPVVYLAFEGGLISRYFSLAAGCLALLTTLWANTGWRVKVGLLAVAAVSWLAAVYAGNVLASCFGGMHL